VTSATGERRQLYAVVGQRPVKERS
jgi:hypothetical protein